MTLSGPHIFDREIAAGREALTRIAARHKLEIDNLRGHGRALCDYLKGIAADKKFTDAELRRTRRAVEAFTD